MKIQQKLGLQGQFKIKSIDPETGAVHESGWFKNQILDSATEQIFNTGLAAMPTITIGNSPTQSSSAFENAYDIPVQSREDDEYTVETNTDGFTFRVATRFTCVPNFPESKRTINQLGIKDFNCALVRSDNGEIIDGYPVYKNQPFELLFNLVMTVQYIFSAQDKLYDYQMTPIQNLSAMRGFSGLLGFDAIPDPFSLLKGDKDVYLQEYLPPTLPQDNLLMSYDLTNAVKWSNPVKTVQDKGCYGSGVWMGGTVNQCKQLIFVLGDTTYAYNMIFNTPIPIPEDKFLEVNWDIVWERLN